MRGACCHQYRADLTTERRREGARVEIDDRHAPIATTRSRAPTGLIFWFGRHAVHRVSKAILVAQTVRQDGRVILIWTQKTHAETQREFSRCSRRGTLAHLAKRLDCQAMHAGRDREGGIILRGTVQISWTRDEHGVSRSGRVRQWPAHVGRRRHRELSYWATFLTTQWCASTRRSVVPTVLDL